MKSLLGQKLYLRIWLAVVAAVAVLTLVVGWLWQVAMDMEREQNTNRPRRLRTGARHPCFGSKAITFCDDPNQPKGGESGIRLAMRCLGTP